MTHPRPLREDDTLGRAGRTNANGKPIRPERVRDTAPVDERRVAIEPAPSAKTTPSAEPGEPTRTASPSDPNESATQPQ
jgi:hypothetical protein